MASVAAKKVPSLGSGSTDAAFPPSDNPSEPPAKKNVRTPKPQSKRPRTRSSALNPNRNTSSTPPHLSGREKRAKTRHSREKSPVIDLTTDVDLEVLDAHGESPLKNAAKPRKDLPTNISRGGVGAASSQDLKQIPNPQLQHRSATNAHDLNSSPIKKSIPSKGFVSPKKSPQELAVVPVFSSSPLKRRKTVAFSDTIVSDVPSSPLCGENEVQMTPRRSILKPASENMDSSPLDPNNSTMWVKRSHTISHQFSTGSHAPNNPEFWQPGTIIQLEPKSTDLLQLVDGCVEVLRAKGFRYKFEVYATLNQIFKSNDAAVLFELFAGDGSNSNWVAMIERTCGYKRKTSSPHIGDLCDFVKRDIEDMEKSLFGHGNDPKLSPARNDPFKSRILSQALKFVSGILSIPSINTCIPANTVKWFYSHTCDMIVLPKISKSLVLPYLSIIKDCHFSPKKRRFIFESNPNPLSERMLFALLDIRSFVSSSLVNEKFIALKNLIQKFPAIMAKNFHHWFTSLVLNLCDISFPLYTKIVSMGITALLEAARNYLDNVDICRAARKLLEFPLPTEQKSFASENLISIGTMPSTIMIDYVSESLKELIDYGHYKFAMDIWVGLTLLLGQFDNGIENWKHLQSWLQIHKYCFNGASVYAKITALSSWKAIIYKVCIWELRENRITFGRQSEGAKNVAENNGMMNTPNGKSSASIEEALRPKIKLLIHVFVNISSVEFQREIIDTLNHLFLSILYILMNSQQKTNGKMLLIYWDKVILPVLMNFYFKKESSNSDMHHLGLGVVNKLLKPATPVNEKSFSTIRCLSHEPVSLGEINSLNPRWVYLRFEKVLPVLLTIFKSEELDSEAKIGVFNNFLNTLKFATKKEIQLSDNTFDIIDSLPMTLKIFFDNSNISYDLVFKLIVNINDTFGASNLVSENDESPGVFEIILSNSIKSLVTQQLNAILSMLHGAIGEKKSLLFLSHLAKLNEKMNREDLAQFIGDCLNNKKSLKFTHQDMLYVGKIFQSLDQNFAGIAKKLIQHIVLLKANEFEEMVRELGLVHWNIQIFKFFVTLMHDAPFEHLKSTCLSLIQTKLQDEQDFKEIYGLLVESRFDHEILNLRVEITKILHDLKNENLLELWTDYLKSYEGDTGDHDQLLTASIYLDIDVSSMMTSSWQSYPKLCDAFEKKFGKSPCNGNLTSSSTKTTKENSIDDKQVELDNMIQSELRDHLSNLAPDETPVPEEERKQEIQEVLQNTESKSNETPTETTSIDGKAENAVEAKSTESNQVRAQTTSPPLRRSERLNRSAVSSGSPNVIEVSSDDLHQDSIETNEPLNGAKQDLQSLNISENSGNEHQSEKTDAVLSNEADDSDKIEDSLADGTGADKRKRERTDDSDANAVKKHKTEISKEISDSDESVKKGQPQSTNDSMEIVSGSSNSKNADSESADSLESLNCVDSQDVSRIANTSNVSEVIGDSLGALGKLSIVKETSLVKVKGPDCLSTAVSGMRGLELKTVSDLKTAMEKVERSELAALTFQERFELETVMMQFILRMRASDVPN